MIGGRGTLFLAVALLLAAGAFDAAALYVPGAAMGLLVLAARTWVRLAARGAGVERVPGPPSVLEQEPYPLRVRVRGGFPDLPGGWLIDPLAGEPRRLRARARGELGADVRFLGRGRRRLEPVTLILSDPLGLQSRAVRSSDGGQVLVLPRIEPVVGAGGSGTEIGRALSEDSGDGAEGPGLDVYALDSEIDGLRPYRRGSPASRIHWPAVARTGELLERRIVAGAETAPLVVLDASDPPNGEALDRAVRAAGSLAVHLARLGGCGLLLPDERRSRQIDPQLRAWPELHARLALVERSGAAPAVPPSQRGEVFWVSAASRLPRSVGRGGSRHGYLVGPEPVAGAPVAFTVAGCAAQRLDRARRPAPARARVA